MTHLHSPIRAEEPLGFLPSTELDAPILSREDRRWGRLRSVPPSGVDLRDSFCGALIVGAIGDAMGRPNEGVWSSEARTRETREYQPWHGWIGGPKGTITDYTQMTMWLAESILATEARHQRTEISINQKAPGRKQKVAYNRGQRAGIGKD